MIVVQWLFWGVVATLGQSVFEAATVGLQLTRISLPFIVGTMWSSSRSRASVIGYVIHLANGLLFTLVYVLVFHFIGAAGWWRGALVGVAHAAVLLLVGMKLLPFMHPRMATEHAGPTARRQLEPPGFVALNYGPGTPLTIALSHVIFGMILGAAVCVPR